MLKRRRTVVSSKNYDIKTYLGGMSDVLDKLSNKKMILYFLLLNKMQDIAL